MSKFDPIRCKYAASHTQNASTSINAILSYHDFHNKHALESHLVKRALVTIAKLVLNAEYKLLSINRRREHFVVFLSRQTNIPSYDFEALAHEFEHRGWATKMHLKKVTRRTLGPYIAHVLKEVQLLARCEIVVMDRYDPVVSLLNFECDRDENPSPVSQNVEYPTKPLIMQIWHAFGAFKKFGYQSTDTQEGHTSEFSDIFNIHRNYSWIVCSGEGCRPAYAEAFSYPIERIAPLNRPEFDELLELKAHHKTTPDQQNGKHGSTILMAPTLRKNKNSAHPFRELYKQRISFEESVNAKLTWSFHPLEEKLPAPGNVSSALVECDIVVTDYSSIAYEAYALGKKVLFYIPDIDEYRRSPGLNADPLLLSPEICATTRSDLIKLLNKYSSKPDDYPTNALNSFASSAFDPPTNTNSVASQIVDFTFAHLTE